MTARSSLQSEVGWRLFATLLAGLLLGYILFDRAFAWVHIPGTPLFVGEIVMLFGLSALATTKLRPGTLIRRSVSLTLLLAFMTWGALLLVGGIGDYSIDAVRDATLWLYGIFAVLMAISLVVRPIEWWTAQFERVLPAIVLWMPAALVLSSLYGSSPPYVPDSSVSVFSHWDPNTAVHSAIALAYLWAVPGNQKLGKHRVALSIVAVSTILVAGFSSRAGLLAVSIGFFIILIGMPQGRARLIWLGVALLGAALSLATLFSVEVSLDESRDRNISTDQLIANVTSIFSPETADASLRGTSDWRTGLWSRVIDDFSEESPIFGLGFGPNIRERFGEQDEDPPARNPHNSHVNVAARMGWVGFGLWAALWTAWFVELARARKRFSMSGRDRAAGLCLVLIGSQVMMLVNAVFNEVAEGPHSAIFMWSLFGLGAYLAMSRPRTAIPEQSLEPAL